MNQIGMSDMLAPAPKAKPTFEFGFQARPLPSCHGSMHTEWCMMLSKKSSQVQSMLWLWKQSSPLKAKTAFNLASFRSNEQA